MTFTIYLDSKWNPVDKANAVVAKVFGQGVSPKFVVIQTTKKDSPDEPN